MFSLRKMREACFFENILAYHSFTMLTSHPSLWFIPVPFNSFFIKSKTKKMKKAFLFFKSPEKVSMNFRQKYDCALQNDFRYPISHTWLKHFNIRMFLIDICVELVLLWTWNLDAFICLKEQSKLTTSDVNGKPRLK